MDQKDTIESNLETVLTMAEFDQGSKYADFNPEIDTVAAYGIGALVAGKVLAKTGLFAVVLIFIKKIGLFMLLGIAAALKGLFSKNRNKNQ